MIIEYITMPNGRVVGREIVRASFEEWLAHVFDHPPQKGQKDSWWWDEDAIDWNAPPSDTVAFLSRTFEESPAVLSAFTDEQIAEGLEYISNMACSDIARTLLDESVPRPMRKKAINSIQNLYSDCFAVRCNSLLSHLEKTLGPPLNGVCYMWWDVFPIVGQPEVAAHAELDGECLAVMEFALGLDSIACRESALHGLGHWSGQYPDFVHRVIDRFIETNPDERPELITYAKKAREGSIQ